MADLILAQRRGQDCIEAHHEEIEVEGGILIVFQHLAFGFIEDGHRQGVAAGWKPLLQRMRADAESK